MQQVCHAVRWAEQSMKLGGRVDDEHGSRMIDVVAAVIGSGLCKKDAEWLCQFLQLSQVTRQADNVFAEVRNIGFQDFGAVSFRIDTYQYDFG